MSPSARTTARSKKNSCKYKKKGGKGKYGAKYLFAFSNVSFLNSPKENHALDKNILTILNVKVDYFL